MYMPKARPRAVETFVNSEINYGVPIHFLWGKTSNSAKNDLN